jgi:uncharacterized protein
MKRITLLFALIISSYYLQAQSNPKIVFDLNSGDTASHSNVIRWVSGISKSNPDAQLEIALYGKALSMVLQDKSTVADQVRQLAADGKVAFKMCGVTMKRNNIEKNQLIPGVDVVPDAILEIVKKQGEGWGYIKVN